MDVLWYALLALALLAVLLGAASVRVVKQIERGVVFRLGRADREVRQPGLTMLIPVVDRLKRVPCHLPGNVPARQVRTAW